MFVFFFQYVPGRAENNQGKDSAKFYSALIVNGERKHGSAARLIQLKASRFKSI